MADKTPQDTLLVHVEYIRERVDSIDARLQELNGRTRQNEQDIAVLEDRIARNANRLDDQAADSKRTGRNWGLTAGGVGSAIGAALAYLFKGAGQ